MGSREDKAAHRPWDVAVSITLVVRVRDGETRNAVQLHHVCLESFKRPRMARNDARITEARSLHAWKHSTSDSGAPRMIELNQPVTNRAMEAICQQCSFSFNTGHTALKSPGN